MNREEFIQFMSHPELLDKSSVDEMRELVHEFPYFQSGHLLYLKNLHLLENIRFPSQLKVSAAHITDREVLYHLLQEKRAVTTPPEQEAEPKMDVPGTSRETSNDEPIILIDEDEEIIQHEIEGTGPERMGRVAEEGSTPLQISISGMMSDLLHFEYSLDSEGQAPAEEKEPPEDQEEQTKDKEGYGEKTGFTDITSTERFSFAVWLDHVQEKTILEQTETPSVPSSRDKTKEALIDKFLSSDPRRTCVEWFY